MAEWRMADIMAERDGLREVFIEPQRARNRARNLRDLEAVRHARPIVVARDDVDLRLVLETTERLRVKDAVAIALKLRAEWALLHRLLASTKDSYIFMSSATQSLSVLSLPQKP